MLTTPQERNIAMVVSSFLIVPPLLAGNVLFLARYKADDPANRLTHSLFLLAAACVALVPAYVIVGFAYPQSATASIVFALSAWTLFAVAVLRASLPMLRKRRAGGQY